jgi:hypothetical protein
MAKGKKTVKKKAEEEIELQELAQEIKETLGEPSQEVIEGLKKIVNPTPTEAGDVPPTTDTITIAPEQAKVSPITWEQQEKERLEFAKKLLEETPEQTQERIGKEIADVIDAKVVEKLVEIAKEEPRMVKIDGFKEMPEEIQFERTQMSEQAKKWKAYLPLQGLTPERFLEKYPNHQYRKYVEEIIYFNKQTPK